MYMDMKLHIKDGRHDAIHQSKMAVKNLDLWYPNGKHALKHVNLDIPEKEVTAFIGPSGCGKTTLLKCLNRMNDALAGIRIEGDITMNGQSIYDPEIEMSKYRCRFGWVAQAPNPFPKSVYENVAYAPKIHGLYESGPALDDWVEACLRKANLWDEVKDRLDEPGTGLSGGQMQRLCIARALSQEPSVMLMDEPCSALDPIATAKVEELIDELRQDYTIIIITHNMQQAARVSQNTAFFHLGEMLEAGDTAKIFTNPDHPQCQDYIHGAYG